MTKRILAFFTTDVKWKLISLGLAFLLWVISWNFINPTENRSFELQLESHNTAILENAGLVILNQDALDTHIRVGVRALRQDFEVLGTIGVRSEYIIPSVDLRAITVEDVLSNDGPVTVRLNVSVNFLTEGLELEAFGISPAFIDVIVDVRGRETHPIAINVEGEIAPGLELMPIRLANSNVTITGPRSLLADIEMVQVTVDVLGIHSETEVENLPLKVITASGNDIADQLQLSVRETTATVPVWPIESVELRVQSTGYLAPGFTVAEIELLPNMIEIVASPDTNIEYILLEIDLNNANETFTTEINLADRLPNGVYLPSEGIEIIEATVNVEPIERRVFNVPRDNVRIRGLQAIYQIISGNAFIRIEVAGSRGLIAELALYDIGLELDLRNLPMGVHTVVLNVSLPEGVSLIHGAPALQVQIHEPAPPDAEDDPVPEPEPNPPLPPTDYEPDYEPVDDDMEDEENTDLEDEVDNDD